MQDVCADFGCELAEFNGAADHVHLLVNNLVAIVPRCAGALLASVPRMV
jgi:REP element-mobilizing transposase RayT